MSDASALLIRTAREADAPVLCAAERETARLPARLLSQPHELSEAAFAQKIAEVGENYLVAENGGTIVAHAFLDFAGPLAALAHVRTLTICVHPGHTGQGVGRALIGALLDRGRASEDIERIELRVRETNAAAIHLYETCGFAEESRFRRRVKLPDGRLIDDIGMVWFRSQTLGFSR